MLARILKKDLKRKKGINGILFLFILIATVFLASSLNNMIAVTNATEYFLDKSNMPDEVIIVQHSAMEHERIMDWLEVESEYTDVFGHEESLVIDNSDVKILQNGSASVYETDSTIMMMANPEQYIKVFDASGSPIQLAEGEIAVSIGEAQAHDFVEGDQLRMTIGDISRTLTIRTIVKDALFAGDMAGTMRVILNEADYAAFAGSEDSIKMDLYYIMTQDTDALEQEFNRQKFGGSPNLVSRGMVKLLYVMELIVAGMLTVIGICLIAIAILVLRFTVVFTMEEEYREIGIMKAIGLKNHGIKSLYLTKYFALVLTGAVAGCIISFPVGDKMLESVTIKMLMESSSTNGFVNVLGALFVIVLVLSLCYLSMHRLNKLSVMDAIRSGQTGERFQKKSILRLYKSNRVVVPVFLAINDVFSSFRRYIVLLLIFAMGIVLMILPYNTINTMKSDGMARQFQLDPEADIFISSIAGDTSRFQTNADLQKCIEQIREEFASAGYDVKLSYSSIFSLGYYTENEENTLTLLTLQPQETPMDYLPYMEGTQPLLSNEIAMSKKAMSELGVTIGDSIHANVGGQEREFIITATYQDYMQLGRSARLSAALDLPEQPILNYGSIPVYFGSVTESERAELIMRLKEDFPDYRFRTAQENVNRSVGGVIDIIGDMRIWLILLMAGINVLITALMMKMFLMSDKGEIAMLRSIGYRNRTIRAWQITRIVGILLLALILAIPLSRLMDFVLLRPIFSIMGGKLDITVVPLEVYVLYPGILFGAIVVAAVICSASVKKIDIREMNSLE